MSCCCRAPLRQDGRPGPCKKSATATLAKLRLGQSPRCPGPESCVLGHSTHTMQRVLQRKIAVLAGVALACLIVLGGVAVPRDTLAAGQPYTNSFNYGSPASPQSTVPSALDVQIHLSLIHISEPTRLGM